MRLEGHNTPGQQTVQHTTVGVVWCGDGRTEGDSFRKTVSSKFLEGIIFIVYAFWNDTPRVSPNALFLKPFELLAFLGDNLSLTLKFSDQLKVLDVCILQNLRCIYICIYFLHSGKQV